MAKWTIKPVSNTGAAGTGWQGGYGTHYNSGDGRSDYANVPVVSSNGTDWRISYNNNNPVSQNTSSNYTPGDSWSGGGSSGGGDWGGGESYGGNAYADYLAQLQAARDEAISKANAAVDAQISAAEGKYRNQLTDIGNDYTDLRNQSEVNRYKAIKKQRESLANQGRLDGGAGRMENTVMNNNFDNNLNKINLQEASERRQIEQAIAELYAQGAALKAQNEMASLSNYGDMLMYGLQNQPTYSYNPATSDYYNAASGLAGTQLNSTNAVQDADLARASAAAIAQAMQDRYVNPQQRQTSTWSDILAGLQRKGGF